MTWTIGLPILVYGALALVVVLLPSVRSRWLGAAGLAAAGLSAAASKVGGSAGGTTFDTVNAMLLLLGAVITVGALWLGLRPPTFSQPTISPHPGSPPGPGRDPILLLGLLLAAVGPHLLVVGVGALLALASASRLAVRSRNVRWLFVLVPAALLLDGSLVLLAALLGLAGGSVRSIAEGPISPAAEHGLMAFLGAGGILISGLRPLHRAPWRLSLAPLAAILLARVAVPALSLGLLDWQALAILLLVGMLAAESFTGHWAGVAVAGGLIALWSGDSSGVFPGCLLILIGWLLDAGMLAFSRSRARWSGLAAIAPALAAPFALAAALRGQVLLSVLAAIAVLFGTVLEYRRCSRVR